MGNQEKAPGALGKKVATVGAAMIAASIVMALFGISGTLHDILQYGGLAAGVVGIVLWRIIKM